MERFVNIKKLKEILSMLEKNWNWNLLGLHLFAQKVLLAAVGRWIYIVVAFRVVLPISYLWAGFLIPAINEIQGLACLWSQACEFY